MNLRQIAPLLIGRLRVRKKRTIVTILTVSALFGVLMAAIFFFQGIYNAITSADQSAFGDTIYVRVGDPYGVTDPEGQAQEVRRIAESNNGRYLTRINSYNLVEGGAISFDEPVLPEDDIGYPDIGKYAEALESDADEILASLIKKTERRDDVIQVLVPFYQAALITGSSYPSKADSPSVLREKVAAVESVAIGRRFYGIMPEDGTETSVEYEIVGLLPPKELPTFPRNSPSLVEVIASSLLTNNDHSGDPFIVINPTSAAFQKAYVLYDGYRSHIAAFNDVDSASLHKDNQTCPRNDSSSCIYKILPQDFLGERTSSYFRLSDTKKAMLPVFAIAVVVAVIIMLGTINRVIDDERGSIALYRAIGASSSQIYQIYFCYILTLGLLILAASTAIGLALSGALTVFSTSHLSSNFAAYFNLPDFSNAVFIGFELTILLVCGAIVFASLLCFSFVSHKLRQKNLVKDLRG